MKRFSLITASLMLALAAGMFCSCHKPAETPSSSELPVTETTTDVSSDSESATDDSVIATATDTFIEDRHRAKG